MYKIYIDKHTTNNYIVLITYDDKPVLSSYIHGIEELDKKLEFYKGEITNTGRPLVIRRSDSIEQITNGA